MKRLWVFDNDGTLYDDQLAHGQFNPLVNLYASELLGCDISEAGRLLKELKEKYHTSSSVISLMREKGVDFNEAVRRTYLKINIKDCARTDPGRSETLSRLPEPKIVLTNNPSAYARKVLEHLGLIGYFTEIIGMAETRFHLKPEEEVFQIVENRFSGFDEFVFCDDALVNLTTANKRGWVTIWYNTNTESHPPVPLRHIVVTKFNEITNVLLR